MFGFLSSSTIAKEPVILGIVEGYPWAYRAKGEYTGIPVDIFRATLNRMGYEMVVHPMPIRRVLSEGLSGYTDIYIVILPSENTVKIQKGHVILGATPLFSGFNRLVALKEHDFDLSNVENNKLLNIGHLRHSPIVESYVFNKFERQTRFNQVKHMLKALMKGRIDIAIAHPEMIYGAAKDLNVVNRLVDLETLPAFYIYPAFSPLSFRKKDNHLIEQFNLHLNALKSDGEIARIISRHSQLIYFGDYGRVAP